MTNQIDLNKFNSLIESAAQAITCNSDCQRNKTEGQLKDNYLSAESNLILAEPEFELARQKYYTYVVGQSGYEEMIEKELSIKADMFIEKFKENYNSEKSKINSQLETYDGLLINFRNIVDLYKQYKRENMKLFKELKEQQNDILTNERKTYYEDQQNDYLNFYYFYFLLIIYYIIVISFCVFSFIYPSSLNGKVRAFIAFVFIILPFFSTLLLGKFIQFIYWLFDLLPKNVYK